MAIRCQACGAALHDIQEQFTAACPYCGAITRITPDWMQEDAPAPTGGRRAGWVAFLVLLLLAGGTATFFVTQGFGALREWYAPPCLVDANGDDVLDVAGWAGTPTAQRTLTVVDGRDGATLWTVDGEFEADARVLCAAPDTLAVTRPDFRLELRAARDGALRDTLRLPDRVIRWGPGDGCLRLRTASEETVDVRLRGDGPERCAVETPFDPWTKGAITGPDGRQRPASFDGLSFGIAVRETGTALATVRARAGDDVRWEVPLDLVLDPTYGLPLVATEDAVVTYGTRPANDDVGWLVGLDPGDGRVVYERPQQSRWSGNLLGFVWTGRHVLAWWGFGLHAYDPATGERVWHFGGR